MTWPSAKGSAEAKRIHDLSPAERQKERNRKRQLAARGICATCQVEPRSSNMTVCKKCHSAQWCGLKRGRTDAKLRRLGCVICGGWILTLRTRTGKARPACYPCYKEILHNYRFNGGLPPSTALLLACVKRKEQNA